LVRDPYARCCGRRGPARALPIPISLNDKKMNKLCIFIGMTVLGWVGWWIGSMVSVMTAFMLSGIGSVLGVYVGWRINRDYLG